jgi:hypothetical protein
VIDGLDLLRLDLSALAGSSRGTRSVALPAAHGTTKPSDLVRQSAPRAGLIVDAPVTLAASEPNQI